MGVGKVEEPSDTGQAGQVTGPGASQDTIIDVKTAGNHHSCASCTRISEPSPGVLWSNFPPSGTPSITQLANKQASSLCKIQRHCKEPVFYPGENFSEERVQ